MIIIKVLPGKPVLSAGSPLSRYSGRWRAEAAAAGSVGALPWPAGVWE